MGIYDRDYYRERSGGFLESWGRQGATVWLIIVTCVVFLLQLVTQEFQPSITAIGIYDYPAVCRGEVWRLITPVFLHAGLFHLAFNMLVLYWAGSLVEDIYGSRSLDYQLQGEGPAFYYRAGLRWRGRWLRPEAFGPTTYLGPDGEPFPFAPGPIWIALASPETPLHPADS